MFSNPVDMDGRGGRLGRAFHPLEEFVGADVLSSARCLKRQEDLFSNYESQRGDDALQVVLNQLSSTQLNSALPGSATGRRPLDVSD